MTTTLEAAQARSQGVRALADRPSQRRNSEDPTSRPHVRMKVVDLEIRGDGAGDSPLTFVGHASVTDVGYEMYDAFGSYTEVIDRTAFDATLQRADLDVPLVLGHDQMRRIARTVNGSLKLSMDEIGLRVEATLDPADADVAYILPKLRKDPATGRSLIDEMSFAFRIEKGQWSADWMQYNIQRVDIHRGDVAIVGWGANPYTDGGMRSQPAEAAPKARSRVYEDELQDRIA